MVELGKTHLVKVGSLEIVCRELTVAAARNLLESKPAGDLVSDALFEEIRLGDLPAMTSLTSEQIEQMLPSDLALVVDGCKQANPAFFALLARVTKAVKATS
ncbi:MAG: hypothetical protein CMK72_01025 [Pseudomonadaceae bacterium]|nr:hypothetical protein [Pseudomonadaceae bacterium]HCP54594.1 hypothetical protein [Pseudomonas sp.]